VFPVIVDSRRSPGSSGGDWIAHIRCLMRVGGTRRNACPRRRVSTLPLPPSPPGTPHACRCCSKKRPDLRDDSPRLSASSCVCAAKETRKLWIAADTRESDVACSWIAAPQNRARRHYEFPRCFRRENLSGTHRHRGDYRPPTASSANHRPAQQRTAEIDVRPEDLSWLPLSIRSRICPRNIPDTRCVRVAFLGEPRAGRGVILLTNRNSQRLPS